VEHSALLELPSRLTVSGNDKRGTTLGQIPPEQPVVVVRTVEHLGIPVGHYVGVDFSSVQIGSELWKLATGRLTPGSLIADPLSAAKVLLQAASHVYLGPHTTAGTLLALMRAQVCADVYFPVATSNRQIVASEPQASRTVVRFLSRNGSGRCSSNASVL
jgi:hypothetical protein